MQEQIELTQQAIDNIFDNAEHQADCVTKMYRLVFANWDDIEKVEGFPSISKATNEYIFTKAIEFDKVKHPKVFNGGMWLNNGFRTDERLPDWIVQPCPVTLKKTNTRKVLTEATKDHTWQAIDTICDLVTSDEYREDMTPEERKHIHEASKHLWDAYNRLLKIKIYVEG